MYIVNWLGCWCYQVGTSHHWWLVELRPIICHLYCTPVWWIYCAIWWCIQINIYSASDIVVQMSSPFLALNKDHTVISLFLIISYQLAKWHQQKKKINPVKHGTSHWPSLTISTGVFHMKTHLAHVWVACGRWSLPLRGSLLLLLLLPLHRPQLRNSTDPCVNSGRPSFCWQQRLLHPDSLPDWTSL